MKLWDQVQILNKLMNSNMLKMIIVLKTQIRFLGNRTRIQQSVRFCRVKEPTGQQGSFESMNHKLGLKKR